MAESQHDEIAKLEALYESNPRGRVFTHLAEAYRKAGKLDRAREIVQDGLRYHEDYASAHVVLGRIYADLARSDDAAQEYRRVLELDPENRIALRGLGDYERGRGNTDTALYYFRQLALFDPADEELAAAVEQLERQSTTAPSQPPGAPQAPSQDVFDDYPAPYSGGYGIDPGHGHTDSGYGYAQPPAEPGAPASGAAGAHEPPPPVSFEPLPLSMDWTTEGGTGTNDLDALSWDAPAQEPADAGGSAGEESGARGGASPGDVPDLRMDWDLDGRGDASAPAPPGPSAGEPAAPADSPGSEFRLDSPFGGPETPAPSGADVDPAQGWRDLEQAASAALPPADYDALPPPNPEEHEAASEAAAAFAAWSGESHEPSESDAAASPVEADAPAASDVTAEPDRFAEPATGAEREPEPSHTDDMWSEPIAAEAPDIEERDLPDSAETEVFTETLAELYRAQGFPERAAEVYRALLADRPGDERLLTRLREMEGSEVIDPAPAGDEDAASWSALAESRAQDSQAWHADDSPPDEADAEAASEAAASTETERPEPDWMESVESAWTGGSGAAAIGDSMFSPPADETRDDDTAGQPVAASLHALLSWKPTRRPHADPEDEVLLLDEVVGEDDATVERGWGEADGYAQDEADGYTQDETDGYAQAEADGYAQAEADTYTRDEATAEDDAGAAEPSWTAPWDDEPVAEPEPDPWDAEPVAEVEADPWEAAPEPGDREADPWDVPAGAGTSDTGEAGADPGDMWMPWESSPAAEPDTASTPPAGDEWMPWDDSPAERDPAGRGDSTPWDAESDADPLAAAAGPGGVGNPFETDLDSSRGAAGGSPAPRSSDSDDDDDDDDLEMFRSWLQSLKR